MKVFPPLVFVLCVVALWTSAHCAMLSHVAIRASATSVVCTVPRNVDNRRLSIGLVGYLTHRESLDGDAAEVTHQIYLKSRFPCLDGDDHNTAFCTLEWAPEHQETVKQSIPCLPAM